MALRKDREKGRTFLTTYVLCLMAASGLWFGTGVRAYADVPPEVAEALEEAGANRASLEAVLAHYDTKETREQYAAACYLIAHMRWHSVGGTVVRYDPRLDSCWTAATRAYVGLTQGHTVDELNRKPMSKLMNDTAAAMRKGRQALRLDEPVVRVAVRPDVQALDGGFVRRVVDHAFALRERSPWARQLSFADFCEYVLPYRVIGSYPLVTDPASVDSLFASILRADTAQSPVDVAARYNHYVVWLRRTGGKYPFRTNSGLPELLYWGNHDCVDIAHYGGLALRAAGIPVAVEYTRPIVSSRDATSWWPCGWPTVRGVRSARNTARPMQARATSRRV